MTTTPLRNRERLAWTILLGSFTMFVALAIAVPFGIRYYFVNADIEQTAALEVTAGTILVTEPNHSLPTAVLSQMAPLPEGSLMETDDSSQGNLTVSDPDGTTTLATVQVYGNTSVGLDSIRSPRYAFSPRPHHLLLNMTGGRIRAAVSLDVPREVVLTIQTPQGYVILDRPASASIEVTNAEMTVIVREGEATVAGTNRQGILLQEDQLTVVPIGGSPLGISAAERNLIASGDFQSSSANVWHTIPRRDKENEPSGAVVIETQEGRRVAHFTRAGSGLNWAFVNLRQDLNRDIRDYRSLRLHMLVQVVSQDIYNCGVLGTECPLMVKINYRDTGGSEHEWLQGFFSSANLDGSVPLGCVSCPAPRVDSHAVLPPSTWIPYDSPNLIEVFSKGGGGQPATLTGIEIYASGHAFDSLVTEIELLAQE